MLITSLYNPGYGLDSEAARFSLGGGFGLAIVGDCV